MMNISSLSCTSFLLLFLFSSCDAFLPRCALHGFPGTMGTCRGGLSLRISLRTKRVKLAAPMSMATTKTTEEIVRSMPQESAQELRNLLAHSNCPSVNGLRVVIIGPPCSGRSLIAPLISTKYGLEQISIYDLVGEKVVSDSSLMDKAASVLCSSARRGQGFVLHGFPVTIEQAKEMFQRGFEVDMVLELVRSDEEAEEWRSGRLVDKETGLVYHSSADGSNFADESNLGAYHMLVYLDCSKLLPPPEEASSRLIAKRSNTGPAFDKALEEYRRCRDSLVDFYKDITVKVDTSLSRSVVDILKDVNEALDRVCPILDVEAQTAMEPLSETQGLASMGETIRFLKGAGKGVKKGGLLSHIMGLNTYNAADFMPFVIDGLQVGYLRSSFAQLLDTSQRACNVEAFSFLWPVCDLEGELQVGEVALHESIAGRSLQEKSEIVNGVIKYMWDEGLIRGWRGEMQPVAESFNSETLLKLERGAVPYFGVCSYGVHVNIFTQDEQGKINVWVARRAKSKATYPGLLDQCVAGGQPSDLGLQENVEKECIEEASISSQLAREARPSSAVAYKYETRKGISPKALFCYDLQVPTNFVPVNADGEVEEFYLIPLTELVESISQHPEDWKPNSALVALDFAIRKGAINPDIEPHFLQIVAMLRGGAVRQ